MTDTEYLSFQVAPHIVEDLGLNLYTDLPRVLVEFIANAHDADADWCEVTMDVSAIADERKRMRDAYAKQHADYKQGHTTHVPEPLAHQVLDEKHQIVILDNGFGMSEEDLSTKFLVAGRRRREQDAPEKATHTPKNRLIMGRKGLGKLAGFGVAKCVEVVSRAEGSDVATKITLDFDEIRRKKDVSEIEIPKETLSDGGGIIAKGTRITLSRLLFEPVKSRETTIKKEVSEHFELIPPSEFAVKMNGVVVKPLERNHAYAYPKNDTEPSENLVPHTLDTELGPITFRFRIRFTGNKEALNAQRRGIRVYAHRRLAASPSLLDADTNMHGFRMTDYMDGVLMADFIDDQPIDYIATDRQSLRWETPLLEPLKRFLSAEIKNACAAYQKVRDNEIPNQVKSDPGTVEVIEKYSFSKKDRTLAFRFASALASSCKQGVQDEIYREKLKPIIQSIGHGTILSTISELATEEAPTLNRVAIEIARLTKDELEHAVGFVRVRIKAIHALSKIVTSQDFKKAENEKQIQKLLEDSPWLIDPTFGHILTGDVQFVEVLDRLANHLKIGEYAPADVVAEKKRPDLVFLVGNAALGQVVIVELKSANTKLVIEHLNQLEYYMGVAETWLHEHSHTHMRVHGHLIGSVADSKANGVGEVTLRNRIKNAGVNSMWRVRDYTSVLSETKAAHDEVVRVYDQAEREAEEENAKDAMSASTQQVSTIDGNCT